jgi:hypothetical protein
MGEIDESLALLWRGKTFVEGFTSHDVHLQNS